MLNIGLVITHPFRHPGLVPGSTRPRKNALARLCIGGCRNKSGMTGEPGMFHPTMMELTA